MAQVAACRLGLLVEDGSPLEGCLLKAHELVVGLQVTKGPLVHMVYHTFYLVIQNIALHILLYTIHHIL